MDPYSFVAGYVIGATAMVAAHLIVLWRRDVVSHRATAKRLRREFP